ncbi:MAG TPA: response regulator [Candidatus Methanoperedens sp.]|nr:response regulator [Candidatus Methanoperedens sp.]
MASVLIVDDDESFATALGRIVKELGHTSERAVDGQDGLAKFHEGDFDLVIADLKMPRMNGVEFIRELKRINKDVVVMVITGYSDLTSAVETLTLGAYDYIEKPVSVERFRAALERGLEKRQLVAQLNFSKGMIWMIVLSIPLWMILGIVLSYFLKR